MLTGVTGFIGGYVLEELLSRGHNVTAMTRAPFHQESVNYKNLVFDFHVDDLTLLKNLPKTIIHLAWAGLPNYKENFHLKENLPAQKNFIERLVNLGCDNITITGTCMEYGMQEGCLPEDVTATPDAPYAQAKDHLRQFTEGFQDSVSIKWVRLFYMYGKNQSGKSIIPQLHEAVENNEAAFNMSGGEQVRDYLPVEQVAKNIIDIALQTKIDGIINCGSGRPQKLKSFIEAYKTQHNLDITLNLGHYPYPDYEPMEFWADIRKLKKIQDNDTKR